MNDSDPLHDLRDIHLPDAIGAWPPAPGWWLLALLIICGISWVIWYSRKRYLQKQLYRVAFVSITQLEQDYLQHQDPHLLVKQYSSLLRRIAMVRFSRPEVASLTGTAWLDFLDNSSTLSLFNSAAGQLLVNTPFRKPETSIQHLDDLTQAVKVWIKTVTSNNHPYSSGDDTGSSHLNSGVIDD